MREVSDSFLLNMAEVSATLIGLFLVGVFFYLDSGRRHARPVRARFEAYLRTGTRITLIVFAIPVFLPMTLVVLDPVWSRLAFAGLSALVVAANADSAVRVRGVANDTGSMAFLLNEVVATSLTAVLLVLPWALGGFHPSREDLTWAILLAFAAGFTSISATVISAFDIARRETELAEGEGDAGR